MKEVLEREFAVAVIKISEGFFTNSTSFFTILQNDQLCLKYVLIRGSHRMCSEKKGVFKISQNSRENTCVGVSF